MTTGSHLVHFLGDVGEEELAGEDRGGALHTDLEERAFLLHKAESKSISALRTEVQKQTNRTQTHEGTKHHTIPPSRVTASQLWSSGTSTPLPPPSHPARDVGQPVTKTPEKNVSC